MSALKLHCTLRSMSPKHHVSCSYPSSTKAVCTDDLTSDILSSRCNGTFSTTFTRRLRTDEADKSAKQENSVTGSSSRVEHAAPTEKKQKTSISLLSFSEMIPLKVAELNRYLTDTSKKLLPLRYLNRSGKSNPTVNGKQVDDNQSAYSLEKTVAQINQSIVSFYDTSCAKEIPSSQRTHSSRELPTFNKGNLDLPEDEQTSGDTPQTIGPLFPVIPNTEAKKKKAEARRAEKISRLSLESRTRALVQSLKSAHSLMSKITRAEELCDHLIAHPECVWEACSEKVVPCLMSLTGSPDKLLRGLAYEALSLLGCCKPLKSPGIRLLSIDGGGTRGLVAIEFLKALEKQSQCRIHELFDYVCGVSTGALLAAMVCLYKIPLDRCEDLYKDCATRMFTRNRVVGTTKLVWNHGFYDSHSWEEILKKEIGERMFVEFSREPDLPKMAAVSSLVTAPRMTTFLFRTYNLPPGVSSLYPGSCKYRIWEVIRASSAAPGYFESFVRDGEAYEDGGILTNNPTALAIHECRLLWPNENFHCVVSLGTGRFEATMDIPAKVSLKRRISTIVDSATDTEAVHHTLQDLLPARSYFRFNPYLSEEFYLDEIRPEKMSQMQLDAQMYTRRNSYKLTAVSERLMEKRKPQQVIGDLFKKVVDNI